MKRLLILLLLFPSLAWGGEPIEIARMNPYVLGAGVAAAPSTFCSSSTATTNGGSGQCEDFNGSTTCYSGAGSSVCRQTYYKGSNWPTFATGSATLNGCTNTQDYDAFFYFTVSDGETRYWYHKVTFTTLPASYSGYEEHVNIKSGNGGGNWLAEVLRYNTGATDFNWRGISFAAANVDGSSFNPGSAPITYHVWTKTDATAKTWAFMWSTTTTRPDTWATCATNCISGSYGGSATPNTFMMGGEIYGGTNCYDMYFSAIFTSTTEIGDNP